MKTLEIHNQSLEIGRGTIDPLSHIRLGEYSWELVERLEQDLLSDESLYEVIQTDIPVQCGDGRTRWMKGASAIGGSFSAVAADALGPRSYYSDDISAKQHALSIYSKFKELGFSVGGHDDDGHGDGPQCGCGGEDRLDSSDPLSLSILGFLCESGGEVRNALSGLSDSLTGRSLGFRTADLHHSTIIDNARSLHARTLSNNPYATSGRDLRDALVEAGGESAVETLHGGHNEVVALLDFRDNVVLNRAKIAERYNDQISAFYINVPSLRIAADKLNDSPDQADLAFTSSLYYNLAATAVLAGQSLRVVTKF